MRNDPNPRKIQTSNVRDYEQHRISGERYAQHAWLERGHSYRMSWVSLASKNYP